MNNLILIGIIVVVLGALQVAFPRVAARLQYRDQGAGGPSSGFLMMTRGVGVVAAVVGIVLIIIGLTR